MSAPVASLPIGVRRSAERSRPERPHLLESLKDALLAGALVSAGLVVLEAAVLANQGETASLAFPLVAAIYLASGVRAWWRRPRSSFGALIMQGGAAMLVSGLAYSGLPILEWVGIFGMTWILAVMVHLLLAFPTGRLGDPVARAVVIAAYVNSWLLQGPPKLIGPEAAATALVIQRSVGVVVMTGAAVLLLRRLREATGHQRRTLVPLYGYGLVVVGLIPVSSILFGGLLGMPPEAVSMLQIIGIAGVPLAFLAATLRGAFAPTAEAEELAMWLASSPPQAPLADALRRALGDPSVMVAYWLPERGAHVDDAGTPVELSTASSRERGSVPVSVGDHRVGTITYDPRNTDDRAVREAARVVALAIDAERLTAQLKAREVELQRSRARIVAAGDRVRERIARDLHDGLQARLVLLGIEAQRIAHKTAAETVDLVELARRATELRKDIDAAASDLRQISYQIMPSAVLQHGLAGAIEDLTARMPIETTFDARSVPEGLSPAFALTAYFTVAEGLSNAVKHAGARTVSVSVRCEGRNLVVGVSDDGVGGATDGEGSGLTGLRDRVEAIGGRLVLDSPPGRGTRLHVEVPCGS